MSEHEGGQWCHVIKEDTEFLSAAERESLRQEGWEVEPFPDDEPPQKSLEVHYVLSAHKMLSMSLPACMEEEDIERIGRAQVSSILGDWTPDRLTIEIERDDGRLEEPITVDY